MCGSRRRLRCRRRVGVCRSVLGLLPLQYRDHIAPLCFALGARHLREFLLTLAQTAFLLRLLALLKLLYNIDRINIRLILNIRHRPERCHILDRRDEERIGAEILQTCSKRTNKTTIHIDWAAAHPLEHTADTLDEIAARPRHDHALRALSALHRTENLDGERVNLTRCIKHRVCRPLHPCRHLAVREDRRHRMGGRRIKIERKRKKRRRCKAFQRISQNVTSKKLCYNRVYLPYCSTVKKFSLVFSVS